MTALFIAAKIEEPMSPSLGNIMSVLNEIHMVELTKDNLLNLETNIILSLDFSLRKVSPIHFIERFFKLLGLDS